MIRLITFATENMSQSMELCVQSAYKHGVDVCWPQNPNTISSEFRELNKQILESKRGAGYWLWKPYHIYKAMLLCEENDILIWSDAGVEFVANVNQIISRMDEDIFFFTNGFPHVEWCKWDCINKIIGFNGHEQEPYPYKGSQGTFIHVRSFTQVQASVIFFCVNQKTKDFVKEWLLYCQMPGFIDDSPSKLPNYPTFAEHRHDQAVLTCLQIKHGYKLHFWPTNYSEHIRHTAQPGDTYPTMFNHHRKRNHGTGAGDAEW